MSRGTRGRRSFVHGPWPKGTLDRGNANRLFYECNGSGQVSRLPATVRRFLMPS
jgi:hypothetical protein